MSKERSFVKLRRKRGSRVIWLLESHNTFKKRVITVNHHHSIHSYKHRLTLRLVKCAIAGGTSTNLLPSRDKYWCKKTGVVCQSEDAQSKQYCTRTSNLTRLLSVVGNKDTLLSYKCSSVRLTRLPISEGTEDKLQEVILSLVRLARVPISVGTGENEQFCNSNFRSVSRIWNISSGKKGPFCSILHPWCHAVFVRFLSFNTIFNTRILVYFHAFYYKQW